MKHCRPNKKYCRVAVFKFIVAYKQSHDGNSPSLRDIMAEFSISSLAEAHFIILNLVEMGLLRRRLDQSGRNVSRSIEIVGGTWSFPAQERAR